MIVLRVRKHVARHAALDKLSALENEHALAMSGYDAEVMRNQEQRRIFAKLLKQLENLCLNRDVQRRRRLVCDKQLRLGNKRGCDHRALSHASG